MNMLRYDTVIVTKEYGDIALEDVFDQKVNVYSYDAWKPVIFNERAVKDYVSVSLTPIIPDGHNWIVPDIDDVTIACTLDQQWVGENNTEITNIQSGDIVEASAPDKNFDMWWIVNYVTEVAGNSWMIGGVVGPLALANGVCVRM